MTDRTPTGDLRDQIAEALRKAAYVCPGDECPHDEDECGENEPIVMAAAAVIDGIPEAMYIDGEVTAIADAVLPVVRSALAAAERRAEQAEAERDALQHRLNLRADALADERRGRLAAEAAVRRVRQVLARKTLLAGPQAEKAVRVADVEAALDAEQPKETPPAEHTGGNAEDCPVCAPLID